VIAEEHAGEFFFHCEPVAVSKAAQDADAARRLWEVSEQLCGLKK
jgi:hypothetical protein